MSKLSKFLRNTLTSLGILLRLSFLPLWLRKLLHLSALAGTVVYLSILITIGSYAKQLINHPPTQQADAALILGNRAYLHGKPNPCLTGRVDEGLLLAQQGLVSTLLMTGGLDYEDQRIEAVTMEAHARNKGFGGEILLESRSSSTLENLTFSRPILEAMDIQNIIITSEPYHMWRVKKLVEAGHLGREINVNYAAAPTQCWVSWGMAFKGALREPLAIINNYAKGYF
ncbi:YdcF family protein [Methylotenera sp.]|uniref:YdcF family protein n=1 Tax=Methylotenera sp. TaxID=2051956 RepID=UPI0024870129|nr:YdcF family protein [Methylotenera sp.]MDI1361477.1 YdcF family protein [Methylotenera sp.]